MKSILKQPQKSRDSELAKYLGISIKEVSKWPINAKSTKRILDRKKTIMSNGKVDNNKVVDLYRDYKFMDGRKYLKTAMYTSIRARPASLFKLLRKTKGKHVLDYGSGVGTHAIICLESGCDGVDLLDVAGPLRKFARWRIDLRSYKNAKYLEHNTTLIKSTYDCVICIDALEHIPDPAVALENMLNALRVGGVFYVLVGKPKIAAGHLTEIWAEWSSLGQKVLQKYCKKISENLYRRI